VSSPKNQQRLGDLFAFKNGRAFKKEEWSFEGLPIIRIQNLNNGNAGFNHYVGEYDDDILVRTGDLLFSWSGTVGSSFGPHIWQRDDGLLNQHIFAVSFKAEMNKRYAYYALEEITKEIEKQVSGAVGLVHITKEKLNEFTVPVPSASEQQRIVAILDKAFDCIANAKANAEKNLQSARALIDIGYLGITDIDDQPNWPTVPVSTLAVPRKGSIRTGPFGSQLLHGEFVDHGIAVLGIDNAVANEFRWDRRRYVTEEKYRQLARYRVFPGDVLITIMGTCGRCAVVPDDIPLAINTKHLCCITLDRNKCLPEFLHLYFLHDPLAKKYLTAQAKGSIMAGLNMGIILNLPVRLPSLEQQAKIVRRFKSLRAETQRLESIYQKKLSALDELKKSLLHQAFTGQVTAARPATDCQHREMQTATPQFAANVISFAYAQHVNKQRERTFGRVKEQKVLHLVEAVGGVDLGRHPMKDAAGPNDFQHMLKAEDWAREREFFEMVDRGNGYDFKKLKNFEKRLSDARKELGPYLNSIEKVIDLLIPMDSEEAGIFATVHAAWNNLLVDGIEATEGAILKEAREAWHPDKLLIPEKKFKKAIEFIRSKGLIPDGTGKYVTGQKSLI
jgi:type I restriction enzyme S subunit